MTLQESSLAYMRSETPLAAAQVGELARFWETSFETSYDNFREVLEGAEQAVNRNLVYQSREGSELVGTCQLTVGCSNVRLGGLGEVATAVSHRRRGIGRTLSSQARDEFLELGGEALFLGTVNPLAARLYHDLGWRKFDGANVMCLLAGGRDPAEFLLEYFPDQGQVEVSVGCADHRLAMIPLVIDPHGWRMLDANLALFSTRYMDQDSCMGLFPRYQAVRDEGAGEWFAATTEAGCLVGLATARSRGPEIVQVDGFSQAGFAGVQRELIDRCLHWAQDRQAGRCEVLVACCDKEKKQVFELLGFSQTRIGPDIEMGGNPLPTLWMSCDV
jgi:GNAT superfamily N-acetyltransferase